MKKYLFLFAILPVFSYGQTSTIPLEQSRINAMNELMKSNTSSLMLYYKGSEVDIKGSKYFFDEYVDGELWFINGEYISKEYVYKFDESENSVQIKDKKGQEILIDKEKINGCRLKIGDKSVVYFRSALPNELNNKQLFQLFFNGNMYQVIKLPAKRLVPKTKIFHNDELQYEYLNEHRYFMKKGDKNLTEIKLKKKDLLKAFPEKKATLNRLFDTPQYKDRLTEKAFAEILVELDKG